MEFLGSTVGRKIIMALTGLGMLGFVVFHLIGNSLVYAGADALNAYASGLRRINALLWGFRLILLAIFALHVYFGIRLTLENSAAKAGSYAVKVRRRATFASKNMIWSGLLIGSFIIYHLFHFTFHAVPPGFSPFANPDAAGRPDVFRMVIVSLRKCSFAALYAGALSALFLHLLHGVQSLFQTLGLSGDRSFPYLVQGGNLAAIILLLGYIAIPVTIVTGLLR